MGLRGFFRNLLGDENPPKSAAPPAAPPPAQEQPPASSPPSPAELARLARDKAESQQPAKGSRLYEMCCAQWGMPPSADANATFSLAQLMEASAIPNEWQRAILKDVEREVRGLPQYTPPVTPALPGEDAEAGQGEKAPVYDAEALVRLSKNGMQAYLFLLPPVGGGRDADPDDVLAFVEKQGVCFGLNEQKVVNTCLSRNYLQLTLIATGQSPVDGEDGTVSDRFRRESEIRLTVKEDNTIDYKDLGWLQAAFAGDVLCDIAPPTAATPGATVRGDAVPGKAGRRATAPKGPNTALNADETALVASIDGVVSFEGGRFRIDPLLIIKGDVETATGNLDVVGDVLIHGDVREGFVVKASGSITVQGMVEGAEVSSGGSIQVGRGMNGNSTGSLTARGDILSKFLENANVTAGGRIICDTVINSTLQCDDTVQVTTGRGSIIGGSVAALRGVQANTIGNPSNRGMEIVLGSTASFLREREQLQQKHRQMAREVDEKGKAVRYLSAWEGELRPDDEKKLDEVRLGLSVQKMQLANLTRRIEAMDRLHGDNTACRLRAETIYPPLSLTIGDVSKVLRDTCYNALVYLKEGDVHVANV